jgi:hypothetical protein
LNGPFHLTFDTLSSAGIAPGGRMVTPLASLDSWFFVSGLIDLESGKMTKIPLDYLGDVHSAVWTADGKIMVAANEVRSSLWRFRPEVH